MTCEERSGPVAGTALVNGVTFKNKPLQYAEFNGLAMFEGDIVLGTIDQVSGGGGIGTESIGITGQQFRWPNATIPYEIDAAMPNQQRVTDAIAHWVANTPIRFVQRTAANAAQHPDYVTFQGGDGCSSTVGKAGGQQFVTLGPGCSTGNAIHEIGHTVGLWHEQSRQDRDTFVQIVWANIAAAQQHNFNQHVSDGDDLGAYDYGSIMHYPTGAFSTNGQATIIPLQPIPAGVTVGQRTALSAGDIAGVRALYPTSPPTIKELPKDPVLDPTRKEAVKDPIRDPTIKEVRKDPISDPTVKELRKDPIRDPTVKEIRKDPVSDPTIKELSKDPVRDTAKEITGDVPIPFPRPRPGPLAGQFGDFSEPGQSAFVLGAPSRAGAAVPELDPVAVAAAHVDEIVEAMALLEQQQAELAAAYELAVQHYEALQAGGA